MPNVMKQLTFIYSISDILGCEGFCSTLISPIKIWLAFFFFEIAPILIGTDITALNPDYARTAAADTLSLR